MPGLNTSSVGQRRLAEQNKRRQAMSMAKSVPPTPRVPSPSPAPTPSDMLKLLSHSSKLSKKEKAVLDPRLKAYTGALTEKEALEKMKGQQLMSLINRKLGEGRVSRKRRPSRHRKRRGTHGRKRHSTHGRKQHK